MAIRFRVMSDTERREKDFENCISLHLLSRPFSNRSSMRSLAILLYEIYLIKHAF